MEATMNDGSPIDECYWVRVSGYDSIEGWAESRGWTLGQVLEEGVWEHDETGDIYYPEYLGLGDDQEGKVK